MKIDMGALGHVISSPANPLLKDVRSAVLRGAVTSEGFWVAETPHLLEEALRSGVEFRAVLTSVSASRTLEGYLKNRKDIPVRVVEDHLFRGIASTETSQGVIGLVRAPVWTLDDLFGDRPLLVVLDGIQDAGNAGAIVRSAEAFGASGVVFMHGTVSPANPKTLRASAGSLFRVPFLDKFGRRPLTAEFQKRKLRVFAASAQADSPLDQCHLSGPTAVIIGSEARGISTLLEKGAVGLQIPTAAVESLNASVAAAVILYEAARQRGLPTGPPRAIRKP